VIVLLMVLARPRQGDAHKRGAQVLEAARARRAVRRRCRRSPGGLRFAGVRVRGEEETKHFKLIGTTGTGKSTAIATLLKDALARGDRAVITDPEGGYLARFYDRRRGDVILNPFDARSPRWNPFAEVHAPWDIEQLVSGLICGTQDASAGEWRGYARTLLTAILRHACRSGAPDVAELWHLLTVASSEQLRPVVAGSPAQPFLEPENARMFGSIRSVAVSAAAALEYVQAQRARPFSVRDWVRTGRGVLFMPYAAPQVAALRSILATWMRLSIFEALGQRPGADQRLWFIVDELDSLGAIDGLKDALTRLRKFGGRCVLGFQSVAQVSSTYGQGEAQTIVENCGNTVILRCSGSEHGGTAQFASRLIGEREVIRRQTARGRDREGLFTRGNRRSTNVSEQHVIEAAVLAAQIEQLPDLTGYVKTAASPAWVRVSFAAER
jgi:type IV secretory pathway TraG/TraD family ATPase VirD4